MQMLRPVLILAAVFFGFWKLITFQWSDTALDELAEADRPAVTKALKPQRDPASIATATSLQAARRNEYFESSRGPSGNTAFSDSATAPESEPYSPLNFLEDPSSSYGGDNYFGGGSLPAAGRRPTTAEDKMKKNNPTEDNPLTTQSISNFGFSSSFPPPVEVPNEKPVANNPLPNTRPNRQADQLVCNANKGSGSYDQPIVVGISCSSTSEISYCLSENTCCDPETGIKYVSAIPVGQRATTYCLSFMGVADESGKRSAIVEMTYTFNPDIPNLEVIHPKIAYQATQLDGVVRLGSDNFGSQQHRLGMINLRTYNPGNLPCEQIVDDYSNLSPGSSFILPDSAVTSYSPTSFINLLLNPTHLVYGDNFITSYLRSEVYADANYACSTTQVTLEDFDYLQDQPLDRELEGAVAVFTGGFSSTGFFQSNQDNIFRGPAGSSNLKDNEQELRVGLLSIFYQD